MATWSNWSGTVQSAPRLRARPQDESEVESLLGDATIRGETVRPVGTGHSHTPLAEGDGVLVHLEALAGVRDCDTEGFARIGAGSILADLGEPLLSHGRAMQNLGDVDVQTLAGALGTGTHGTGRRLGGLATQVAALRIATPAEGVLVCTAEENADVFDLARVSLGALGILTEVTLRTVPAYRLHERVLREDVDPCLEAFDDRAETLRHCEFFWYPQKDVCEVKLIDATEAAPDPLPDRRYERIDHSHRILPSDRTLKFVELEFAVPADNGLPAFRALRTLMQEKHPDVAWPVEVRTVAADDVPLSPASGRATLTVSVHQSNDLPFEALFRDAEALLVDHGGRPHWGKWHSRTARDLAPLYPRWNDFLALRERLDPSGVLLSPALRRLLIG